MKKISVIMLLIGAVLLLAGCQAKEEVLAPDSIALGAQPSIRLVEAYGVIKPDKVQNVTIGFPAAVEEVQVKNGQEIKFGDTLMTLNIDEFKLQIREKENELDLFKKQNNGTAAEEESFKLLEENLQLLKDELTQDNINQNLIISDTKNGLVYNIVNNKGDALNPGSELLSIADLDSVLIRADVGEQFIGWVSLNSKADIIPEYNKNVTYKGTVSFISKKAIQVNGETVVPVEITFDEMPEGLILDSDVQVKIYPAK